MRSRSVSSRLRVSTSSMARRRAISRCCASSSRRMRSSVRLRSCTMRDFSTASRAAICACSDSCSRSARSRASSVRWLARRTSTSRSWLRRAYSDSRSMSNTWRCASRFWVRIATSVSCSMLLRILRRFSMDCVSSVRPSASKALDGSKNSRRVWSRSTSATDSSSSPLAASDSLAMARTALT